MSAENSQNRMSANDRAALLAEKEFLALCLQAAAAKRRESEPKRRKRQRPDFFTHYLNLVAREPQAATHVTPRLTHSPRSKPKNRRTIQAPKAGKATRQAELAPVSRSSNSAVVCGLSTANHGQKTAKSSKKTAIGSACATDTTRPRRENNRISRELQRNV